MARAAWEEDAQRYGLQGLIQGIRDEYMKDTSDASASLRELLSQPDDVVNAFQNQVIDNILKGENGIDSRADRNGIAKYMLEASPFVMDSLNTAKQELDRLMLNKQQENLAKTEQALKQQEQVNEATSDMLQQKAEDIADKVKMFTQNSEQLKKVINQLQGKAEEADNGMEQQPVDGQAMQTAQQTTPDLAQPTPPAEPTPAPTPSSPAPETPPAPGPDTTQQPGADMGAQAPAPDMGTPSPSPDMGAQSPAPAPQPEMMNPSQGILDAVQSPYGA